LSTRILIFRCDADVVMGTGHVMRSLALAQAWQDAGGRCVFAMSRSTPAVALRLQDQKIEVESFASIDGTESGSEAGTEDDARRTISIAARRHADWIVVDGYQFNSAYQSAIKAAGLKMLFLDDNVHAAPYSADLVLNQNFHATPELYARRDPSTQLLLGPRYAMLRREFRSLTNRRRNTADSVRKILVTMGGSDPENATMVVIEALRNLADLALETTVLIGGSNPQRSLIEDLVREHKSSIHLVVDAPNVAQWMQWADLAISGAGTTVWELCFLGLPALLIVLAPNQQNVAAFADKLQIAWSLGKHSEINSSIISEKARALINSATTRATQSRNGQSLVDGRGADRVVAYLSGVQLRPTSHPDCQLFWDWANDPEARNASFRNKTISWPEHERWFKTKMEDSNAVLYTATNQSGTPIGQVRYQIEGDRAVLSISLGLPFRGCGWGQKILTLATDKFFQERTANFIDAFVKPTNAASLKLFENTGFHRLPSACIEGQEAIHFVLQRTALTEVSGQ
jgi:UDP-2,4-diacetamido-2,4,6-trideoxy-beta-L-altropyranose hydrolase